MTPEQEEGAGIMSKVEDETLVEMALGIIDRHCRNRNADFKDAATELVEYLTPLIEAQTAEVILEDAKKYLPVGSRYYMSVYDAVIRRARLAAQRKERGL